MHAKAAVGDNHLEMQYILQTPEIAIIMIKTVAA